MINLSQAMQNITLLAWQELSGLAARGGID